MRRVLHARVTAPDIDYDELKLACGLVVFVEGVTPLLELARQRRTPRLVRAACDAVSECELEADELRPFAQALAQLALEWLEHVEQQGIEPPVSELNAVAGVLGKAAGVLVPDAVAPDPTALAIMERALKALLTLLEYGAGKALDASNSEVVVQSHFSLLFYTLWSLREACADSPVARARLQAQQTFPSSLSRILGGLVDESRGAAPADEADSVAMAAFQEGLTLLALLGGAGHAVAAMQRSPGRRSVQVAGCVALRNLVQLKLLQGEPGVAEALRTACLCHPNDPELETPAMHALGLLGDF